MASGVAITGATGATGVGSGAGIGKGAGGRICVCALFLEPGGFLGAALAWVSAKTLTKVITANVERILWDFWVNSSSVSQHQRETHSTQSAVSKAGFHVRLSLLLAKSAATWGSSTAQRL
jgi:hypothetical protein